MSETNMKIWDQIGRTDPKHTKEFTRAGGFKGTAIRPMYAIQKMTEVFGPCGEGWGYTKPEYTVQPGSDGQVLVFCVVGLWHGDAPDLPDAGNTLVYGVGGDFVIVKQSSGLRSDDEAFKKAFTDALMNAMKHLGMSADVHMNQFDANKYVQQEKQKGIPTRMADDPDIQQDMKDLGYDPKKVYDEVIEELNKCQNSEMLTYWKKMNDASGKTKGLPSDLNKDVKAQYLKLQQYFAEKGE